MKIDSPAFHALLTPDLQLLRGLFEQNNYELRIAGGAVRDLLMGRVPADIDFATSATPQMMVDLFTRSNIRMLHTNGEKHGTVTARIGEENFEVTTLRIDKDCDGRHAKVEFTTDWEADANRRDLTINAMFMDLDGTVVDYVGGIEDCQKRRVSFVGEAAGRIKEDYLRILRYFRFFGRISAEGATHEETTIRAIVENREGLKVREHTETNNVRKGISPERIWLEMKRIVVGRQAPSVVRTMMEECGLTSLLGLPADSLSHMDRYEAVYSRGKEAEQRHPGVNLESMTAVASLCASKDDIDAFHAKTKLSNLERTTGEFVVERREEAEKAVKEGVASPLTYWRRLLAREFGPTVAGKVRNDGERIRDRVLQLAITVAAPDEVIADLLASAHPLSFPIDGKALLQAEVPPGQRVQFVKMYLFDLWVQSDFTLTKDELLTHTEDPAIPSPPPKEQKGNKRKSPPTKGNENKKQRSGGDN